MSGDVWGLSTSEPWKGPTRPDQRVARLAARQSTIVSTGQLAACGIGGDAITVRLRRGHLHRVFRGVYSLVPRSCVPRDGLFTAAVLACGPGAVLSNHAAAAYHGMLPWGDDRRPEVTVTGDRGRRIAGINVHRTRGLDAKDIWRRESFLVTSPERTALDLAATTDAKALRRTIRQAMAERRVQVRQLVAVIDRSPGHHGIPALRAVVADGYVPTRSELEDLFVDLLDDAGIERPALNERRILEGEVIVPDIRWPRLRLTIELDGAAWHDNPLTREHDAHKQALMEADGDRVLRITWRQAAGNPNQTVARIEAARVQQGARVRQDTSVRFGRPVVDAGRRT